MHLDLLSIVVVQSMVPNSGTLNSETPSIAVPKSLGTNAPLNSGIVPLLRSAFSIAAIVPLLRTPTVQAYHRYYIL